MSLTHGAEMPKKPKQLSRTPVVKKVSAKAAAPKPKSAKANSLAGGFLRMSETHIRKVY